MYVCKTLNSVSTMPFHGFTFASLQNLLYAAGNGSVTAVGAYDGDTPVGLALALFLPDKGYCRLASLFVAPEHRKAGVATMLLRHMEDALSLQGFATLEARFHSGRPTSEAARRVLVNCNWPEPEADLLICRCNRDMANAEWLRDYTIPADCEIISWFDVRPDEIEALKASQLEDPWIPESLRPWTVENPAFNSVAMRSPSGIVGWVLTQRFNSTTLVYSNSYMHPVRQRTARILPLYVAAVRHHLTNPTLEHAVWVVPFKHPGMVSFVRRRIGTHMEKVEELFISLKTLQPSQPQEPVCL